MNDHRHGAFFKALENVRTVADGPTTLVVETIIRSKGELELFESNIEKLDISEEEKQKIVRFFVDQLAALGSVMCALVGKSFRADILPLVEKVTEETETNAKKSLQ